MLQNLVLATAMVCATVSIHFGGLLILMRALRSRGHQFRAQESVVGQGALVLSIVIGIFAIHTIEIWLYALMFNVIGAIDDFETALYFSTVTFTSLGYGDITLDKTWRLFAAIEAANGLILFAWSTAFLLSVTSRLRTLEHDWLERREGK
jgi:Ion channel